MIIELRKVRMALADVESQLELSLNQAQEKIDYLQNQYNNALQQIDTLNSQIKELTNKLNENVRQNSNTEETSSGVSEVPT